MGLPHVSSFMGCLGLERGTKIIGFLHTIIAIILVCWTSILASYAKRQIGTIDDVDHVYSQVYKGMTVVAVTGSVHIILGAVLLVGTYKRKPTLLRSWVLLMSFLYVAAIVFIIVVTIVYGPTETGVEVFVAFLEGTAFFLFVGYCIICVHSFYEMLKSDESMCGPQ